MGRWLPVQPPPFFRTSALLRGGDESAIKFLTAQHSSRTSMSQGSANVELLLIIGADREGQVTTQGRKIQLGGSSDLHLMLPKSAPRHRLHVTPQMLRQRRRPELIQY